MDTNAAPVVSPLPDNISASGARRAEAQQAAHHTHSKKAIPSEDAEDPLDGLREQSLRKETGVEARRHERLDHVAARAAKHEVDTPEKLRFNKPTRRAGFGSLSAAGGHAGKQPSHFGAHTKTEGLASDISADAREFEAARAGIATSSEEEEEQEEAPEAEAAQEVEAPPLAMPQGVSTVIAPPELVE